MHSNRVVETCLRITLDLSWRPHFATVSNAQLTAVHTRAKHGKLIFIQRGEKL